MVRKTFLIVTILITISVIYVISLVLFKDFIFLTNAGLDGEPHKAKYIFGGWFALLLTGFILSLVYLPKGRK